jgi:hypothetical protein
MAIDKAALRRLANEDDDAPDEELDEEELDEEVEEDEEEEEEEDAPAGNEGDAGDAALAPFADDIEAAAEELGDGINDPDADFAEFEEAILLQLDGMDDAVLVALDEMSGMSWEELQDEGASLVPANGALVGAWLFWAVLAISDEADDDEEPSVEKGDRVDGPDHDLEEAVEDAKKAEPKQGPPKPPKPPTA